MKNLDFLDMWYDQDGNKIKSLEQYAELQKNKTIALDTLSDGKIVSTVWLGLDHSYNGDRILIFETMVFPSEGDYNDIDCDRYSTKDEAVKGHRVMVDKWGKYESSISND